jgi:hypothetical protein
MWPSVAYRLNTLVKAKIAFGFICRSITNGYCFVVVNDVFLVTTIGSSSLMFKSCRNLLLEMSSNSSFWESRSSLQCVVILLLIRFLRSSSVVFEKVFILILLFISDKNTVSFRISSVIGSPLRSLARDCRLASPSRSDSSMMHSNIDMLRKTFWKSPYW